MTKKKRDGILSLFFKFSFGGIGSAIISFFSTPIITALIIPEEFGKASLFTLAFNFTIQICLLGTDQSFVRKFYEKSFVNKAGTLLWNALLIPLFIYLIIAFIIVTFSDKISVMLINHVDSKVTYLLLVSIFFGLFDRFSSLLIRMKQKAVLFSWLRVFNSIISISVTLLYIKFIGANFYAIIYGTLISVLLTNFISIIIEWKDWSSIVFISKNAIKSILYYGLPFLPTFLVSWIFEGVDKIALRKYSSFEELGLFTAAYKIVAVITIIQTSFSTFWTPIAYEAYESNSEENGLLFKKVFNWMSCILFLMAFLLVLFKKYIMLLFSVTYAESGYIMPFLVLMPIMYTLSEITVGGINFSKKTYWHFVIVFVAAIVNVIGNFFLVPYLGAKGAAVSTSIAYVVFFYSRTYIAMKLYPVVFQLRKVHYAILLLLVNAFFTSFYKYTSVYFINWGTLIVFLLIFQKDLKTLVEKLKSLKTSIKH